MKLTLTNSICTAFALMTIVVTPASAKSWVDNDSAKKRVAAKVVKDDMVLMRTEAAFKEAVSYTHLTLPTNREV